MGTLQKKTFIHQSSTFEASNNAWGKGLRRNLSLCINCNDGDGHKNEQLGKHGGFFFHDSTWWFVNFNETCDGERLAMWFFNMSEPVLAAQDQLRVSSQELEYRRSYLSNWQQHPSQDMFEQRKMLEEGRPGRGSLVLKGDLIERQGKALQLSFNLTQFCRAILSAPVVTLGTKFWKLHYCIQRRMLRQRRY